MTLRNGARLVTGVSLALNQGHPATMPADAPRPRLGSAHYIRATRMLVCHQATDRVTLRGQPAAFHQGLLVHWLGHVWRVARLERPETVVLEYWGRAYLASPKLYHPKRRME